MTPKSEFEYKKYLQLIKVKRYRFVLIALLIMTGVAIGSYLQPERYEARCTVFIEKSVISELVKGIAVTPSIDDKIRVLAYAIKSRALLLKVLNDLDLTAGKQSDAQLESMIKSFQDRTDVRLKDREGIFTISFQHEDPRLARDYVNTLVRRYIEENVASKRDDSYDASRFLSEQIATVKEKFEQAEANSNSFRRDKMRILAEDPESLLHQVESLQDKLDEINIKRNQLEAMRNIEPLQVKLDGLQKRLSELNMVYTENYPEVIEVKNLMATVKEQMKGGRKRNAEEAQNSPEQERFSMELRSLQENERNVKRLIASKRALMREIPATRTALEELEREKSTKKHLYEQLIYRHGQSEVSKQVEVQDKASTFRIVDPAITPVKPFSPNRLKIIFLGILAGLAGSFALLVILDYLDSSIRNVDDLKSLGVPVLAVVPRIENPAAVQATRRRDIWFFTCSGAYFSLILATLTIEFLQSISIDVASSAQIKMHLSQLKDLMLR